MNYIAQQLAHHEAEAWKAHHLKDSYRLTTEMATIYSILYGIDFKMGMQAGWYTTKASWLHDIAELLGDLGQEEESTIYWDHVEASLYIHYEMMLTNMQNFNGNIQDAAKQLSRHDKDRWKVHHDRNYNQLKIEMAKMYGILFNVKYTKILPSIEYVVEALQLHDVAEKHEDESNKQHADRYWKMVKEKLELHFDLLLKVIGK